MLLELLITFGLGIASGYVLREAIVNSLDDSEKLSMATSVEDEWYVMHGHSRLYWFQRRDNDPDPVLRRLPLRDYAYKKALLD